LQRGDQAWQSVPDLLRAAVERFGDSEALVDGDARFTYAQLGDQVARAAQALIAAGVEPGDRVAIWAPNRHEWVTAVLGLLSVGAILVPLNTRYKGAEASYVLNRSRATMLITVGEFLGLNYLELLANQDLPHLRTRVVFAGGVAGDVAGDGIPAGAIGWADLLAEGDRNPDPAPARARAAAVMPQDVSDIMFTSGTTGSPKGVLCTHAQTLRAYAEWADVTGLCADDRYLIVNPLFHTFGLKAGVVTSLMAGATMVLMPVFNAEQVLEIVEAERITALPGPPTIYQTLLAHPRRAEADLSSLRMAVTGAAVIPTELVNRMRNELGLSTVLTAYGLTEASGFVTTCRRGDDVETIATTSGRAINDVEVRVVDESGSEVPRCSAGEIVCRGYNVMTGYFEEPELTAKAIDNDGWLHTGDVGTMDDAGNLSITGRKHDMFIVGGFNAYPAEIENLLLTHGGIAQAAVVGVPDERLGEVAAAFVVPNAGVALSDDEVMVWARGAMANFKVPRQVFVMEALPVNASGKVLKDELRSLAMAPPTPS
jgi:acyl-CoA synthetase (AMP-forming)/AMP-acid ligase II